MKKVITLVLAAIMMASLLTITVAETGLLTTTAELPGSEQVTSFKIADLKYDGEMLTGKVIGSAPEGKLVGVSVTLYLSGNRYIQFAVTLIEGEFEVIYSEAAEYITVTPITLTRLSDLASRTYYYANAVEYTAK